MEKSQEEYDVIIIGAGPSGLSAAHELAEKKLKVCVLEAASFVGGKPISAFRYPLTPPPTQPTDLERYLTALPKERLDVQGLLPIEHGFRVYPENYYNLLSIMKRIPTENGGRVNDHLTNALRLAYYVEPTQKNKRLIDFFLSKIETVFFGLALYLPYILCDKRALKYDEVSIDELFCLKKRSPELRDLIFRLTDSLSSGMMTKTSSLAVINILMNYLYAPERTGFRTFNQPTHLAWLNPWETYLKKLGVEIYTQTKVTGFTFSGIKEDNFENVQISEVVAVQNGVKQIFRGKYIIAAIPVDALIRLINQNYEILRYDPRLIDLYKITTLPATGVQLFYEHPIKGFEKQLIAGSMVTHPWGISYVDQTSYWKNPQKYANSYGVISIYTAIVNQPGRYIPKTMQNCTANEIAYEMFTEVENELKRRGLVIPDRIGYSAHSYQQRMILNKNDEPAVKDHFVADINEDQVHLCTVGMRKWRPKPETLYLGNLILCGAYTQNNTFHVSTMESACESGRRGANTLLQKFRLPSLTIHNMTVPGHIRLLRKIDKFLFAFRIPNPIDLLVRLLQHVLNTQSIHMDGKIRSFENLHW